MTRKEPLNAQVCSLPPALSEAVARATSRWEADRGTERLWARDASLWTGQDEARWLGWLSSPGAQRAQVATYADLAAEVRRDGITHVLLLGMGGSSLAPEVLRMTFGPQAGWPDLIVLDSTDPAQASRTEQQVDLARTLVVVASKSGTTLEPNVFKAYFYDRVRRAVGEARVGRHFVAITDPGSKLHALAEAEGFLAVCLGEPSIGGRFSALSPFGLVPAALMGLDTAELIDRTEPMVEACRRTTVDNPGVVLGLVLGVCHAAGRDKLTIFTSPTLFDLGAWLEQLVAESTGKQGKAIVPVDLERLASPDAYGDDRVFVSVRLEGEADEHGPGLEALESAGHPVVRITLPDRYGIGQEFFRWEIATAVAGALMGIHPFDQPDVEASKTETRRLTTEFEQKGALPGEAPVLREAGMALFTDLANARALERAVGDRSLVGWLRAHIDRLQPGDYFALLAYVDMHEAHAAVLQEVRHRVGAHARVATCFGFGPRFLHSTGQAYKGGPNTGVFLQVTCDDRADLPVPGAPYTFGVVKAAQARGDFAVLAERGRRALRVHLGPDVTAGLARLRAVIDQALAPGV